MTLQDAQAPTADFWQSVPLRVEPGLYEDVFRLQRARHELVRCAKIPLTNAHYFFRYYSHCTTPVKYHHSASEAKDRVPREMQAVLESWASERKRNEAILCGSHCFWLHCGSKLLTAGNCSLADKSWMPLHHVAPSSLLATWTVRAFDTLVECFATHFFYSLFFS